MKKTPEYTVALCTHNHADRLQQTLSDFLGIRLPEGSWEFLIIDNGSRDETPIVLKKMQWPDNWLVRVVREEVLGLSNARNRAIAEARGEYLIFIDDDETADRDWLCAYERLIKAHRPDAFGGRIEVAFEDDPPAWLGDELLGFLGQLNRFDTVCQMTDPSTSFYGGNFGFRVSLGQRIGGFDAELGRRGGDNNGGEEVDFYRRLLKHQAKVWWTPDAVIYHRIQAAKLSRRYFLDLHYRQGRMEGRRKRRDGRSRVPPLYLYGQLWRAVAKALKVRFRDGAEKSLRSEMNVAYFVGYLVGWVGAT